MVSGPEEGHFPQTEALIAAGRKSAACPVLLFRLLRSLFADLGIGQVDFREFGDASASERVLKFIFCFLRAAET